MPQPTDDQIARAKRMLDTGLDAEQLAHWIAAHEADRAEINGRERFLAELRTNLITEIKRLREEQRRVAEILACTGLDESITTPSNIPNVARDRMAEVGRLQRLTEFLSVKVGDETPGDTLIRLASLITRVKPDTGPVGVVAVVDWCVWLKEFGGRLNEAANAAGEKP